MLTLYTVGRCERCDGFVSFTLRAALLHDSVSVRMLHQCRTPPMAHAWTFLVAMHGDDCSLRVRPVPAVTEQTTWLQTTCLNLYE